MVGIKNQIFINKCKESEMLFQKLLMVPSLLFSELEPEPESELELVKH